MPDLTPQELDIVTEIADEAFGNRRGHVYQRPTRYRQMDRDEFELALCKALTQQRFAHLRLPKSGRGAS